MMASAITWHMSDNGLNTMGFIGFFDALGENFLSGVSKSTELKKIRVIAVERFSRADTSVTGKVLKLLAARPDAVVIGGLCTPATLPLPVVLGHELPRVHAAHRLHAAFMQQLARLFYHRRIPA